MYPYVSEYCGYNGIFMPTQDEVEGVQALYGTLY